MEKFTASNGIAVGMSPHGEAHLNLDPDGKKLVLGPSEYNISADLVAAMREFFRAEFEQEQKPWLAAQRGDVWLFETPDGTSRALAWRAVDSWDVIDSRGNFHKEAPEPTEVLARFDRDGFSEAKGVRIYEFSAALP